MRILLNLTDDELITRIQADPKYLIDREGVAELIIRFQSQKAKLYQAEQIIDNEDTHG